MTYTDLADFPGDTYDPALDHDDALHHGSGSGKGIVGAPVLTTPAELLTAEALAGRPKIVPFVREIKRGTVGWDVVAMKRSLSRAHEMQWGKFTRLEGPSGVNAVRQFQRDHHLTVDGVYGRATHAKLAPFYEAYEVYLLHRVKLTPQMSPIDQKRLLMRGAALLTWHMAPWVHYTQGPLRMSGIRERDRPPKYGREEDCSSEATWLAWVADAPDPNNLNYDLQGFTGTISAHCPWVSSPKVGSFLLYGSSYPYHHIATVIQVTPTVLVQSHGSEIGPVIVPAHYRADANHYVDIWGGK